VQVLVEVIEFKSVVGVRKTIEGWCEMGAFLFSWLFSCEVEVVVDGLPQPCIIIAFNGVREVIFEEFVALEEVANDWDLAFMILLNLSGPYFRISFLVSIVSCSFCSMRSAQWLLVSSIEYLLIQLTLIASLKSVSLTMPFGLINIPEYG
jgi:hypothetical protein